LEGEGTVYWGDRMVADGEVKKEKKDVGGDCDNRVKWFKKACMEGRGRG
jgi:hypothetical protein